MSDEDTLSSLAGRLVKLDRKLSDADRTRIERTGAELSPDEIARGILNALEPDAAVDAASALSPFPTEAQVEQARADLIDRALLPLAANPNLRAALAEIHERAEQALDTVSVDHVLEAGFAPEDSEKARATVESFHAFIEEHKDEITALQIIFNTPKSSAHLTYAAVKELAARLEQPPHTWTTERLWRAYAQLERDRVRGVNERRVLTDLVSLVRHAVALDGELVPYPERVAARYHDWLAAQEAGGKTFTPEQRWWLDRIAGHIGVNLAVKVEDLGMGDFYNKGGQFAARKVFGEGLNVLLDELNTALGA